MPLARATGIGSTFDCADHSKSVCFFDSAIISSPLIVASVSVAIPSPRSRKKFFFVPSCVRGRSLLLPHLSPLGAELVPRIPLRDLVGLRDPVTDCEEHHQILARAGQIPVRQPD